MAQYTTPLEIPPVVRPPEVLTTRTIVAKRSDDGIIRLSCIAREETVDDARENVIAVRMLSPQHPALLLVDMSLMGPVPPEVRSYYESEEVVQVIGALALLVKSSASRLVGNIVLRFHRLQMPIRLFTTESCAVHWLQSQRRDQQAREG